MNINKFIDFFISSDCLLCKHKKSINGNICRECYEKISVINTNTCSVCGFVPEVSTSYTLPKEYICGNCKKKPFLFNEAASVSKYDGVIKDLIHLYKYQGKTQLSKDFLSLIWKNKNYWFKKYLFDLILHVPLHNKRLKHRGFDQSFIIANGVGRYLNVESPAGIIERVRNTESQTNLNRKERVENVKNAFQINKPETIKNKTVLLIDDVFTTGATINECSKVLIKSGAKKIIALTIART